MHEGIKSQLQNRFSPATLFFMNLITPKELLEELPLQPPVQLFLSDSRKQAQSILAKQDHRIEEAF